MKHLRTILSTWLIIAAALLPANVNAISYTPANRYAIGWDANGSISSTALGLSATNTWLGFSFIIPNDDTLDKVLINLNSITGSLSAGDLKVEIYPDSTSSVGQPDTTSSLGSSTTTSPANYAGGAGFYEFTGMSISITAHRTYWVVVKNLNGSPASNFPSVRWSGNGNGPSWIVHEANNGWTWGKKQSADGGSTWGTAQTNIMGPRLHFSGSGKYAGLAWDTAGNDTTNIVYSTREVGNVFTTPTNAKMNVMGVAFSVNKSGSPTGNPRARCYEGTTLVATSSDILKTTVNQLSLYEFYFTSPLTMKHNTSYRCAISETTQSDTSSNYYHTQTATIHNNASSLAEKPFNGTMSLTYYDGATWTDTSTKFAPMLLLIDSGNEFTANSDTVSAGDLKTGVSYTINGSSVTGTYTGSDRWTDPGESNVRLGTAYKANSTTNNKTGTVNVPTAANTKTGVATDVSDTGTYTGSDRWSDPGIANVRSGTTYQANSLTNNRTGTASIPVAADVRSGTAVDATTGSLAVPGAGHVRSGTAVDATTGTLVVPTAANVKTGVAFETAGGTTGTYDGSDRWTDPGIANVYTGVQYKANSTTNNRTGTLIVTEIETGNINIGTGEANALVVTVGDTTAWNLTAYIDSGSGAAKFDLTGATLTSYVRDNKGRLITISNSQHAIDADQVTNKGEYSVTLTSAQAAILKVGSNQNLVTKIVVGGSTVYARGERLLRVKSASP